jgi:hypothetical protein
MIRGVYRDGLIYPAEPIPRAGIAQTARREENRRVLGVFLRQLRV